MGIVARKKRGAKPGTLLAGVDLFAGETNLPTV
jgi:hypothetical protein